LQIDFDNGAPSQSIDGEVDGEKSQSFTFNFSSPGTYVISAKAYNNVSEEIASVTVEVLNPIPAGLYLNHSGNIDNPPGISNFTIGFPESMEPPTDGRCRWAGNDGSEGEFEMGTSRVVTFQHVLRNASLTEVMMTVNCSNRVSWTVVTPNVAVNVTNHRNVLGVLEVSAPGVFLPYVEEATFTQHVTVYDGSACVTWEFGAGVMGAVFGNASCCEGLDTTTQEPYCHVPISAEISVRKVFTDKQLGSFILNVSVSNAFSSDSASVRFGVLKFVCEPPVITLMGQGEC
jgi:hypothetical protein